MTLTPTVPAATLTDPEWSALVAAVRQLAPGARQSPNRARQHRLAVNAHRALAKLATARPAAAPAPAERSA